MSRWLFLRRHKPVSMLEYPDKDAQEAYRSALGIDPEKGTTSFNDRVRLEYRLHTAQYWFVASLANGLLWAQILIGAALTALGASRTPGSQTATIYLGAASTITAGLLTYFKSRNQPNRARQLRQALRIVRNNMDDKSHLLTGMTPEEARDAAHNIIKQYNEALAEAAANYPDLWVTLGDLRRFLPSNDPVDKEDESQPNRNSPDSDSRPGGSPGTEVRPPAHRPPNQYESQTRSSETRVDPTIQVPDRQTGDKFSPDDFAGAQIPETAPSHPKSSTLKPETPTKPEEKPAVSPQPSVHPNQATLEPTPSEKSVRHIATNIDIDKDFSHADDAAEAATERVSATAAATEKRRAPLAAVPQVPIRIPAPVAVRRVGGFVLLD